MLMHTLASALVISKLASSAALPRQLADAPIEDLAPRAASLWQPPVGTPFQMMISQQISLSSQNPTVSPDYLAYDVDLFDTPKSTINALKASGKKVICYFSAGTAEKWRPDYKNFTAGTLGAKMTGWEGERWVNTRSQVVWNIMFARIKLASDKGCDAIDPDNMDGYSSDNHSGFKPALNQLNATNFLIAMAKEARKYNMAIGLKNAMEILPSVHTYIQFAVNEQCAVYNECDQYKKFTNPSKYGALNGGSKTVGKPVFHVEYVDQSGDEITSDSVNDTDDTLRQKLCLTYSDSNTVAQANNYKLSTSIKTMDLDGWVMDCAGNEYTTASVSS